MERNTIVRPVTAVAAALGLVAMLLAAPVMAQTGSSPGYGTESGTTTTTTERNGFDPGWLGLLGLFGLMGMRRREEPQRRMGNEPRGAHA